MRLNIKKSILENIVASMQPFLEKKDQSSITSHIYLEVKDDTLTVKATDYEMGLKSIANELKECIDGKATVNGVNILNILRRLKDSDIVLEVIDNDIVIRQNKSNFKLHMYDATEFPSFPEIENLTVLSINKTSLINSLKKITPSIDNNNPKYELNGALIDVKSTKINFVSTDTRRLSVVKIENNSNAIAQIIVPKKAVIEIQKLFSDDIQIKFDETNLILESSNSLFFTKLQNGKFPDYEKIIPTNLKQKIQLPKDSLVESIKLVTSLFANIKITFSSSSITFESLDEDSEAKTQIDYIAQIEHDFYIAVNSKYLLDFLSNSSNEKVMLGFNDSNMPFYLEDGNFSTIIMPIVI